MGARREATGVGKIQVLRDQETSLRTSRLPDIGIGPARKVFVGHGMHIVAVSGKNAYQSLRQIFVKLDSHANAGAAGSGKSSSAETAANAITARRAS